MQDGTQVLIHGNFVEMDILSADEFGVCIFRNSENFIVIDCYGLLQTAHLYNLNNRIKESFEPIGKNNNKRFEEIS